MTIIVPNYIVTVLEHRNHQYLIAANSKEEAREKIRRKLERKQPQALNRKSSVTFDITDIDPILPNDNPDDL